MAELFINFQMALDKFGTPQLGERLSHAALDTYRGRLPDSLLQFWEQYDLGVWMKGYFQFCNPETAPSSNSFLEMTQNLNRREVMWLASPLSEGRFDAGLRNA